jgi:Polysaccharide deacetylase
LLGAVGAVAAAGCRSSLDDVDAIFFDGDGRKVHCAMNLDKATGSESSNANVFAGLDRARDTGEIIELFAHRPGVTVDWDDLEAVIAGAEARQLRFVSYAEMLDGATGPGIALSFDDAGITSWYQGREMFRRHGARATFFVTRYAAWNDEWRQMLRDLASDGHSVEPHGRFHFDSPQYVEEHGVQAFLDDEVLPSIESLREDGYTPTTYAYPFGARTPETDRAILRYLPRLRSLTYSFDGPGVSQPCPR